ncbi:MAG: amidohydrolase family protein [Thermoprotei archaeon]
MPSLGGLCALVGDNLEPLFNCEIVWKQDKIVSIEGQKQGRIQDIRRIVIPSFINAHTHIGDSIAKDAYVGLTLEEAVDPHRGLKTKILSNASKKEITHSMRRTLRECVSLGVTHIIDFREGGLEGLSLAEEAARGVDIGLHLLGRLATPPQKERVLANQPFSDAELEELHRVCEKASGLGVSGANEYSDKMLEQIGDVARSMNKLIAVHCLESENTRTRYGHLLGKDEFQRCIHHLKPHIYVHMTCATPEEVRAASLAGKIVSCPRSNAALANGFPPLKQILEYGGGLGTDNVMVNSPDMFREMEFCYKTLVGSTRTPNANVGDVLKAATVNVRGLLGLDPIQTGAKANFVVLNLESPWNVHASIVNRAQKHSVRMVVKDGRVVHKSSAT